MASITSRTGLSINSTQIFRTLRKSGTPALPIPLKRLEGIEAQQLLSVIRSNVPEANFRRCAAPIKIILPNGTKGTLCIGYHKEKTGTAQIKHFAAFQSEEGKITIVECEGDQTGSGTIRIGQDLIKIVFPNFPADDLYCRLTDLYESTFQRLQTHEIATEREKGLAVSVHGINSLDYCATTLRKLRASSTLDSHNVIHNLDVCNAILGTSINWNPENPSFTILEKCRELRSFVYYNSSLSGDIDRQLKQGCDMLLVDIAEQRTGEEHTFSKELLFGSSRLEFYASNIIAELRLCLLKCEAALSSTSGHNEAIAAVENLRRDEELEMTARLLGSDGTGIINNLSSTDIPQILDGLQQSVLLKSENNLDFARAKLLDPLIRGSSSGIDVNSPKIPALSFQLHEGGVPPFKLFERFAQLNAKTAREQPQSSAFNGTEHRWTAHELFNLYQKYSGSLITISTYTSSPQQGFYLLLPNGTPFAQEKKAILKSRGTPMSSLEHYTYLVVIDRAFSRNYMTQGVDLYLAFTKIAAERARLAGAQQLLARVRIDNPTTGASGNTAIRAHERVKFRVIAQYESTDSPYAYGILQRSTWPEVEEYNSKVTEKKK